jgi:hypothetical protein
VSLRTSKADRKTICTFFLLLRVMGADCLSADGNVPASIQTSEALPPGAAAPVAYQVGAFLDKSNAEHLIETLFQSGFSGDLREKIVRGDTFYVVTVAAAINPFENRQEELLDAGFPSFPVRE